MTLSTHQSQIHTLRPGDKNFQIYDKFVTAPRAGFEVSENCPYNHLMIIQTCIEKGWLKPVASITKRELLFIGLNNETN